MINTVKDKKGGYLLNDSLNVPKDSGNRHYQEIKQWIDEGNTPQPQYTAEELTAKEAVEANEAINEELKKIDLESIRAIREYIVAQPDAPQILKDREVVAVNKRAKIK